MRKTVAFFFIINFSPCFANAPAPKASPSASNASAKKNEKKTLTPLEQEAAAVKRSQPAFDGAEGPGAYTQGGRGPNGTSTRVIRVTTLDDTGQEGSLRWAVAQEGPRIIAFNVSGYIHLFSDLVIDKPYITIDGAESPERGIGLRDGTVRIENTHDVIIRNIRIRPGDDVVRKVGMWASVPTTTIPKVYPRTDYPTNGLAINNSLWCIIDHCSISWAPHVNLVINNGQNISVQWCFIYSPLDDKTIGGNGACIQTTGKNISLHKNYFGYFVNDGPLFATNEEETSLSASNNVIGFFSESGSTIKLGAKPGAFQFINNLYVARTEKRDGFKEVPVTKPEIIIEKTIQNVPQGTRIYLSGNIGPKRESRSADEWANVQTNLSRDTRRRVRSSKMNDVKVQLISTEQVERAILNNAGALPSRRDPDDNNLIKTFRDRIGWVIKTPREVGGYAELNRIQT